MKKVDYYKSLLYIKISDKPTHYCQNRHVILNRAKQYYKNNKERLRGEARIKYRRLSEEEKHIKREYGRNRYTNISEENKRIKKC